MEAVAELQQALEAALQGCPSDQSEQAAELQQAALKALGEALEAVAVGSTNQGEAAAAERHEAGEALIEALVDVGYFLDGLGRSPPGEPMPLMGPSCLRAVLLPLLHNGGQPSTGGAFKMAELLCSVFVDLRALEFEDKLALLEVLAARAEADPEAQSLALERILWLTEAERLDGPEHAAQEGVKLRLALVKRSRLLPAVARSIVDAPLGPEQDAKAAQRNVRALVLLGQLVTSINHDAIEDDTMAALSPLDPFLTQERFWRRFLDLAAAPAAAAEPNFPSWPPQAAAGGRLRPRVRSWRQRRAELQAAAAGQEEPCVIVPRMSRAAMLHSCLPSLLFCEQAMRVFLDVCKPNLLGILAHDTDCYPPGTLEHVEEAVAWVEGIRQELLHSKLHCPCCQKARLSALPRGSLERDRAAVCCYSGCRKDATEVPGGLKYCAGCRVAMFCSVECQKAAWVRGHRSECKRLRQEWRQRRQSHGCQQLSGA